MFVGTVFTLAMLWVAWQERLWLELGLLAGAFALATVAAAYLGNRGLGTTLCDEWGIRHLRWIGETALPWNQVEELELSHRKGASPLLIRFRDRHGDSLLRINTQYFPHAGRAFVRELEERLGRLFERNAETLKDGDGWLLEWDGGKSRVRLDQQRVEITQKKLGSVTIALDAITQVSWLPTELADGSGRIQVCDAAGEITIPDYVDGVHEMLYVMRKQTSLGTRVDPVVPEVSDALIAVRRSLKWWRALAGSGGMVATAMLTYLFRLSDIPEGTRPIVTAVMGVLSACGLLLVVIAWRQTRIREQRLAELEARSVAFSASDLAGRTPQKPT